LQKRGSLPTGMPIRQQDLSLVFCRLAVKSLLRLFVDFLSMSKAIVILIEEAVFRFDECYTCPYRDDQFEKRTVKELAESAIKGCPVCFVHHYTVTQGLPDITSDDKVFGDHANPLAGLTVETPNLAIQWREIVYFVQCPGPLRK